MKNPLISIIVPVYNVSPYLSLCLDSLIGQTYPNIEIILINDGSTDDSLNICSTYAIKHENIKVLNQQNKGIANVRNLGIREAKGSYISFVDSDDFVSFDFIEHLFNIIADSDLAICDFKEFNDHTDVNITNKHVIIKKVSGEYMLNNLNNRTYNRLTVVPWNKLYKKDVLMNVTYPEGRIHEDEFVIHRVYHNCKNVVISNSKNYFYRNGHLSITLDRSLKSIEDAIFAFDDRKSFFENLGNSKLMSEANDAKLAMYLYNTVDNSFERWRTYELSKILSDNSSRRIKLQLIFKKLAPQIFKIYRKFRGFK